MECKEIFFTGHAIQRMFERNIDEEDIIQVIKQGEVIENYPDDMPYPSHLILGNTGGKPLHVVAAFDSKASVMLQTLLHNNFPGFYCKAVSETLH